MLVLFCVHSRLYNQTRICKQDKKNTGQSCISHGQNAIIFFRLGLLVKSCWWNSFKDNKEIKITCLFRYPCPERKALWKKQNSQIFTSSPFTVICLGVKVWHFHIPICWFVKDYFSSGQLYESLWKENHKGPDKSIHAEKAAYTSFKATALFQQWFHKCKTPSPCNGIWQSEIYK